MGYFSYILKRLRKMNYKAMNEKIGSIAKKTGKSKAYIFYDMQKCARKHGAGYMDYDLYEMYNLNEEQRKTYITRGRNNDLVRKYCDLSYMHIFENKDEFNKLFSDYLKRDWIIVKGTPKEDVLAFIGRHSEFMAKECDGKGGFGIEKITTSSYESADAIYEYITKKTDNLVLEELIQQDERVAAINPYAINTVRVVTILTDDKNRSLLSLPEEERSKAKLVTHVVLACFRIGTGTNYVDNFHSDGLTAPMDEKTGTVIDNAISKKKVLYEKHPATGTMIKGFTFPYWDEVIDMVTRASKVVPQMGYCGWDIAFTPNGPVFVEGNEFPGHDLYQLPEHTPNKIGMVPRFTIKEIE